MSSRDADRALGCSGVSTSMRVGGAYVTAAEWTRAMRHHRSTFHHFVTPPPPPLMLLGILFVLHDLRSTMQIEAHNYSLFYFQYYFLLNLSVSL